MHSHMHMHAQPTVSPDELKLAGRNNNNN